MGFSGAAYCELCTPQFSMVVPLRSQARLRHSLLHWAYFALLRSTIRNSRLATLPLASLLPLSSAWSLRIVRKLTRGSPCFTGLIGGYCSHWLRRLFRPHWAYYGLFPPQAAAFARPSPVSAKILRISGRGNCKETIFALENGIFRRKNRPVPAVHAAGDDFNARGLRFHNSQ